MRFILRGSVVFGAVGGWRIGIYVSYVTQITDEIHFAWQRSIWCSWRVTHWNLRFICDADHWWDSFCVVGAIFGAVGGWLFVAGAVFGAVGGWLFVAGVAGAWNATFFNTKLSPRSDREGLRSGGCEMTILSSDIFGLSSNRLSIGGSDSGTFTWDLELKDFVAGAVLGEFEGWLYLLRALEMTFHMWRGCSWRVTFVAPRIVNDVAKSYRSSTL